MLGQLPWWKFTFLLTCLLGTEQVRAEEITLAVAANFAGPIKGIIADFEAQTDHQVKLILGSSGKIYAQIKHGAPFDVFLSADRAKPLALEKDGWTVTNSRFTYAIGALALWSADPDFIKGNGDVLTEGKFHKIAIANPKLAPYGTATKDLLKSMALWQTLSSKLVRGENIAQTYQFIATGNAPLGFVALSQIFERGKLRAGSVWIIPPGLHNPIRQDAVILKSARDNPAAHAFSQYLRSDPAQKHIQAFGYTTPEDETWGEE